MSDQDDAGTDIKSIVRAVSGLLPQQAPLHAFVHHNALHHWESLPFDAAVKEACETLGTQGYQSEDAFHQHLMTGRIRDEDIQWVARLDGGDGVSLFDGGPTSFEFRYLRLKSNLEIPRARSLDWHLHERAEYRRIHGLVGSDRRHAILGEGDEEQVLAELWRSLAAVARPLNPVESGVRWRDGLVASGAMDPDRLVHPLLIRVSAAFLDQGVSYWRLPNRDRGLLFCFRESYGRSFGSPARWQAGLPRELRRQHAARWSAEETIEWAMEEGGVPEDARTDFVRETLLSLRGWAGMVRHLEERPDHAPVEAPHASLTDYLAVQLVLDLHAARFVGRALERRAGPLAAGTGTDSEFDGQDRCLIYEAFVMAQLSNVPLARFSEQDVARLWLDAVEALDEQERRRLLHLAYERRHRIEVLDAFCLQPHEAQTVDGELDFQAVFCIDDREESTRRHLEEIAPRVETFGYAGFFGVAMAYEGAEDIRPRPLCPVVISPKHHVREQFRSETDAREFARTHRRRGRARLEAAKGTRTLVRGGFLVPLFGPLSIIPLVGHALFPHLANRIAHWFERLGSPRPPTRLLVETSNLEDENVESAVRQGYRVAEMADIVSDALGTMGLDPARSKLVIVVGHGSSSLNNPHEAAHDCGATGGGRGGPNARAFAVMANHPEVRSVLVERGCRIPAETWFVGAYHNTCDDSIEFYDTEEIPAAGRTRFEAARKTLARACELEAHERVRRFETAPLSIDVDGAVKDAEEHSIDLAQPRPEYGHATNAICYVGRRAITRNLFLDRRAFLVSYDPLQDPDGKRLAPLLLSVGPVGAGINLEYYFSFVDPIGFGCGTKLPHNISGLLGVMDGHSSDLRPGLPWQMVEIHEPVRLLTIVDASRSVVERVLDDNAALRGLIANGWIQFVTREPQTGELFVFEDGLLRPYTPEANQCPNASSSREYYAGHRNHLKPAWISRHGYAQ